MDIITLTTETKKTIDLDKMSLEELKEVVKHLWHKVDTLEWQKRWKEQPVADGITYWGTPPKATPV